VEVVFHVSPYRSRRGNPWFGFSWPEPIFQSWHAFSVDIKDAGDSYEITAELPGVPKENITLDFNDGYLTIGVKQEAYQEEDGRNYLRRERRQVASQRSFYVGNVDPSQVKAQYSHGVLEVTLPKPSPDQPNRRQIPIQ
jgi:HSP20 family protein